MDLREGVFAEVVTFSTKDAYVYAPLPKATTIGHRAELWNVDKWLKEVSTKTVRVKNSMLVRLEDPETCELFAEAPLPQDGTPLTTVVEPVVDSSRYFVLKVVNQVTANHAFIGLGFRNRSDASNFTTALDEYRRFVQRSHAADAMREEAQARERARAEGESGERPEAGPRSGSDLSLKPGQTLKLALKTTSDNSSRSSKAMSLSGPSFFRTSTSITVDGLKLLPPGSTHSQQPLAIQGRDSASNKSATADVASSGPLMSETIHVTESSTSLASKLSFRERSAEGEADGGREVDAENGWGDFVG